MPVFGVAPVAVGAPCVGTDVVDAAGCGGGVVCSCDEVVVVVEGAAGSGVSGFPWSLSPILGSPRREGVQNCKSRHDVCQ